MKLASEYMRVCEEWLENPGQVTRSPKQQVSAAFQIYYGTFSGSRLYCMITRITDGLRLSEKHNFIRKLSYIIYGVPLGSSVTKHCTLITWKIEFKKDWHCREVWNRTHAKVKRKVRLK